MTNSYSIPTVPRLYSLSKIRKFVKNPVPILDEFHNKYGDSFYLYLGGMTKSLVTRDPEVIKEILQKQHKNFEKSKLQTHTLGQYLGKGLLTNTGKDWLRQRRLIQPGFHRERIENLIELMMGVINNMGNELRLSVVKNVDITSLMHTFSFEIMARTMLSQPLPEDELNMLLKTVNEVQEFIVKQVRMPFLLPYFQLTGQVRKNKKMVKEMRSQLLKYIETRRGEEDFRNDLLQMLLDARYEDNGEPMSNEKLIDEILILFVAGHETSANALSWTLYLLCQHPHYIEAIRNESSVLNNHNINMDTVKQLSLTERVIQEAMRLYPPAWITDREALTETEIKGINISKGEMVVPYIYGCHRNPAHWEKPEVFDPDRFLPERIKARAPFAYLPFGGGPRFCIGNNFSMMEMQLTIAYLCKNFNFSMENFDIEIKPLVTLRPAENMMMKFNKISDSSES